MVTVVKQDICCGYYSKTMVMLLLFFIRRGRGKTLRSSN